VPASYNDQEFFAAIVVSLNKIKPDFVLNVGDSVAEGSDPADWATFETAAAPLAVNPPPAGFPSFHFPTTGGHERCGSDSTKSIYDPAACDSLRAAFPFLSTLSGRPGKTQNYYSFSYGNSYFIVLNTYDHLYALHSGALETSSPQYEWLADAVAESVSFPNVFVFGHDGPYLSDKKECGRPYVGIIQAVNMAYIRGHNLLYFGGHDDNLYGFFDCEAGDGGCKKAKYFVTAGAGGDYWLGGACAAAEYANDVRARTVTRLHHFTRVAISDTTLRVTILSELGAVVHDFYLVDEYYSSPSQSAKDALACNFNMVCEQAEHENEHNCPGDCTPTCTSFGYSDWSACSPPGTQTRTVVSSSPAGCQGGYPITSRSCSLPIACE
jgi:hypothetical protein